MTPDQLRELLLSPEEADAIETAGGSTAAAVLVPLFFTNDDPHVVLTKRRDDLDRHAGEISFPGGRQDFPEEDLQVTALREAEEEIGLPREDVELLGALPPTGTFVTGFRIHPYVGVIEPGHEWKLQPNEVEVVLELRLSELVLGYELKRLVRRGIPFKTPTYTVDGNFVWGATARILEGFIERIRPLLRA